MKVPGRLMVGQRVLVPLVGVRVPARQQVYYIYILQSKKNNNLYTGFTNDIKKHVQEHNQGKEGLLYKKNVLLN